MAVIISLNTSSSIAFSKKNSSVFSGNRVVSDAFLKKYCDKKTKNATDASTVKEIGSLRTEFTQTFLNADGTYTLVENTEAIAFKNQKGELELFDNTVIENVHTVNDTEYLYSNTAGYYKVYFGNQTEGNAPILLANAGNSIQIASSLSKNLTVHKATDAKLLNNSNELFSIDEVQKCVFYGHDNDCESGIIYSPHNNALNQNI